MACSKYQMYASAAIDTDFLAYGALTARANPVWAAQLEELERAFLPLLPACSSQPCLFVRQQESVVSTSAWSNFAAPQFAHLCAQSRLVQLSDVLWASVSLPLFLSYPPVDRGLPWGPPGELAQGEETSSSSP